ncbi:unnamed protein product [Alopecurus aequalis]
MKARRMLNMVTETLGGGSLSRINASHHLFYPSTAQAQHHRQIQEQQAAAAAAAQKDGYDGVLRLPPRKLRFEPSPSNRTTTLGFFPFGSEGSKIVCVDEAGRSLLYDADACTVHTMPALGHPTGLRFPASFAVTRADAHDPDRPEALYLLDRAGGGFQLQALVYGDPDRDPRPRPEHRDSSVWLHFERRNFAWHWRQLPPPPGHDDRDSLSLQSYALLHGRTICVSFNRHCSDRSTDSRGGTYCFDTGTGEWTKAGDWTLPFHYSRALHVPELGDDLLFGINGDCFCAIDVSDAMNTTNNGPSSAPVLRHAWPDVDPTPPDWYPSLQDSVAYLGAGRFCIHRCFDIMATDGYGDSYAADTVTLLTGVEVVRDADSSKLRMVRHKSKRIDFNIDHLL